MHRIILILAMLCHVTDERRPVILKTDSVGMYASDKLIVYMHIYCYKADQKFREVINPSYYVMCSLPFPWIPEFPLCIVCFAYP